MDFSKKIRRKRILRFFVFSKKIASKKKIEKKALELTVHRVIFFKKIKCSISFGHFHQLYIRELINDWFHFGWYNFLKSYFEHQKKKPKWLWKITILTFLICCPVDKIYFLYTYTFFVFRSFLDQKRPQIFRFSKKLNCRKISMP